jgi:hypothetical protein
MKAKNGWEATMRGAVMAAGTVASLYACAPAWADGGTIRFVGAIVAPTFGIGVGGGVTSGGTATVERRQDYDAATGVTTVALTSDPNAATHAELSVVPANGASPQDAAALAQRIQVGFKDGAGRRAKPDASGGYLVGAAGGVLSIAAKPSGKAADASMAMVMMDYR